MPNTLRPQFIADAAENADHLVNPEDAIRIAMARQ
jgi:hypothetical protein